jgi:O-antigen ligase
MNAAIESPVRSAARYKVVAGTKWSLADKFLIGWLALVPGLAVVSAWNPSPLASAAVEMCAFLLALATLLRVASKPEWLRHQPLFLTAAAIPVIGCMQLATGLPAYAYAGIRATLYWMAVAALVLAGEVLLNSRASRSLLLSFVSLLGLLATFVELQQIYGYHRYEVTTTGYPLLSSNYYAEIAELVLPVSLTRVFRDPKSWWVHLALACLMVSTVVAAAARVGSILVVVETVVVVGLNYGRTPFLRQRWKRACAVFVILAATLMALQGPSTLVNRLRDADPLAGRSDVARSTVDMIRSRPLTGYGVGSFPSVYPAFARFDNGYFVNHAHNDWLEAMAEGGPVLLAALAAFVGVASYFGVRSSWGLGLAVLPLHAVVDFPMQRAGVILLYAVIAAAASARRREIHGDLDKSCYLGAGF